MEAHSQLFFEPLVFVDKAVLLGAGALAGGDGLADHHRDDRQQAHCFLKARVVFVRGIDADGAHDLLLQQDRHADKGCLASFGAGPGASAVEKEGFAADAGHDDGFARFYYFASNALADSVAAAFDFGF